MKDKLTKAKLGQIMVVLVILLAAFWFKTVENDEISATLAPANATYCDIAHKTCTQQQGELMASAHLIADKLQPESPFQLNISLSDPNATVIKSRLEGHSMYMGTLPALIKQQTPGVWQGQALVGACTESSMVWAWVLDIEYQGQTQPFTFLFEVKR